MVLPLVTAALGVECGFLIHMTGWLLLFSRYGCGQNAGAHQAGFVILSVLAGSSGLWLASQLGRATRTPPRASLAAAVTLAAVLAWPYVMLVGAIIDSPGWACGD